MTSGVARNWVEEGHMEKEWVKLGNILFEKNTLLIKPQKATMNL